jgi:hypothetical protein
MGSKKHNSLKFYDQEIYYLYNNILNTLLIKPNNLKGKPCPASGQKLRASLKQWCPIGQGKHRKANATRVRDMTRHTWRGRCCGANTARQMW